MRRLFKTGQLFLRRLFLLLGACLLLSSCTLTSTLRRQVSRGYFFSSVGNPPITIEQIQPLSQSGQYHLTGKTTLSYQSEISVLALRSVQSAEATSAQLSDLSSDLSGSVSGLTADAFGAQEYHILDRTPAQITDGAWTAELSLTQREMDGVEPWQRLSSYLMKVRTAADQVTFMAVSDPGRQSDAVTQQLLNDLDGFERGHIQLNEAGEIFAIATKSLKIDPPTQPNPPTVLKLQTKPPMRRAVQPAEQTQSRNLTKADESAPQDTLPLPAEAYLY